MLLPLELSRSIAISWEWMDADPSYPAEGFDNKRRSKACCSQDWLHTMLRFTFLYKYLYKGKSLADVTGLGRQLCGLCWPLLAVQNNFWGRGLGWDEGS
jgi:hypothetical protein